MRFTIVATLAALAYADAEADLAKYGPLCLEWVTTTAAAKIAAGTWASNGVDENNLPKYKLASNNDEVTDDMIKAEAGYDTSGCPEADAANAEIEAATGTAYLSAIAVVAATTALAF